MFVEGITVGIVTKNRPRHVDRLLSEIAAQATSQVKRVVVYDNSTNLETRRIIEKHKDVIYLWGEKKQPGGRNEILRCVETNVVYFLDDDVHLYTDHFRRAWEDYTQFRLAKIGGIGGPAIPMGLNRNAIITTHGGHGFNRLLKGKNLSRNDHSACWLPSSPEEVDFLPGGNMSFYTETLLSVGGFDERFGRGSSYREETDPQLRIRASGFKLIYDPMLRVGHIDAPSGGTNAKSITERLIGTIFSARNDLLLMRKNNLLSLSALVDSAILLLQGFHRKNPCPLQT